MTSTIEPEQVLPRWKRAAYGLAETGLTGVEVLVRVGLLIFYTDYVGLDPRLAGYAIALAVIWDAITDPIMGRISDLTRSRLGRRLPWILGGSPLLAGATVLLFSPPQLTTDTGKFCFLLGSYVFFNTAMTIVAIPHAALGGDLTRDPGLRNELFGWRMLAGNIGMLLGTVLPGIFLAAGADPSPNALRAAADQNTAMTLAVVITVTCLVSVICLLGSDRVPQAAQATPASGLLPSLKDVLRNRALRSLLAAYLVATIGLTVNSAMALFYYRYRLNLQESETRMILGFFMMIFCLSIPVWIMLARRVGKKRLLIGGIAGLGLMTSVTYPLFPPGSAAWPLLAALLGGLLVGSVVLLDAALADVADFDQVFSGESRVGLYFGFWKLAGKTSRAIALAISGHLLGWIGFTSNTAQTEETSWKLALIFGPGVGIFFLAAAALAAAYPLNEAKAAQVRRILGQSYGRRQRVLQHQDR